MTNRKGRFSALTCQSFLAMGFLLLPCGKILSNERLSVEIVPGFVPPAPTYERPDLTAFDTTGLRASVPSENSGKASIVTAEGERLLSEAIRRERGDDLRRRQGGELRVIAVSDGVVQLSELIAMIGDESVAHSLDGVVTLRLPLMIRSGATLVINGAASPKLRLSTDRGAFVINGGALYVVGAEVSAWNEGARAPSHFVDKNDFRPFIASLVRSETYLIESRFSCLGYAAPTAYGISLSTQPERVRGQPTEDSPRGIFVGNEFDELYYGFYSFEARDVAIIDNLYTDNIVYGIDPHDRSTRLLIAGNRAVGTRQRHGIIGSRGVSDSLIIDNVSNDNAGSGIMLDRDCRNVVVAGNQISNNGQGIAIYESHSNRVIRNTVTSSAKSALRVRNSIDTVAHDNTFIGSGDYAIDVSARHLSDHAKRASRGDLYETEVEVSIHGVRSSGNYGFAKAVGLGSLQLSGVRGVDDTDASANDHVSHEGVSYDAEQNRRFGSELKPLTGKLAPVFDPSGPLVRISR